MSAEPAAPSVEAPPSRASLATFGSAPMVMALVCAVTLLLWPTAVSLHAEWTNTQDLTFLHGYLIAALSVWILLRALASFREPPKTEWRVLPILFVLSLAWLVAERAAIEIAHQVLWPIILLTAVCAAVGVRNGARCWFAFALLYFAIPIWSVGDDALQSLTVVAVKAMLRLSGIPAFVEGNIVHIPEGVFAIEAGCNGMHFFIVAISIAALYGEIHGDLFKVRVRQVLLAAGIALASNWIRVYVVIVAGHLTDMQHYLIRVSHYYFGWAVFAVCMAVFFWLVSRTPARPLPTTAPVAHSKNSRGGLLAGALAALAVAGTGPVLGALAPAGVSPSPHALLVAVPGWLGPEIESTPWQPVYPGSDRAESAGYRRAGTAISSYIAEYDDQRQGKELVGYGNSLLHGIDGTVTSREPVQLAGGEALSLEIAAHDGTRSVVTYFYEIGGSHRISGPGAQLTYAVKSIFRPTTSRVVAVQVMCANDCAAATAAARQWLEDFAGSREL